MNTKTIPVIRLEDYRPSDFLIERVELCFALDPVRTHVSSVLHIKRREGVAQRQPIHLDGDGLTLVRATVNGLAIDARNMTATPDLLTIANLPAASTFTIEIETEINPQANTQLMGLYATSSNYCTQCEAEGFRRITYFIDRPDVLATYQVRIEGAKAQTPLLLSNGNLVESGDLGEDRHFAVWHDPHPKPSYLFALFAGDLGAIEDTFTTMSGRQVKLQIFVEHGKEDAATYAMDALKRSMAWDEQVFGREYDLDIFMIVAVSDFNMGAMENKGLNIFNDKYVLAKSDTATDLDYANIEAIIAHEYFHNWTGNRITCRDWFQLCLKEGLTVYRDHEFSADMRSRPVKRIAEVRALRAHQFPEDGGPLAHPVRPTSYSEINNFYTATVYEKGSEVVRMFKTVLGDDMFKAGLDLYFNRYDGTAATIEDFLSCFEEASGEDLTQFALWYHQPGTPNLAISTSYDQDGQRFTVTMKQSLKAAVKGAGNAPMHMPVKFALLGAGGRHLGYSNVFGAKVTDDVIHLREARQVVTFEGVQEKPVLSALRGFSAPVTMIPAINKRDALFLARYDDDGFNRWEAISSLQTRVLVRAASGKPDTVGKNLSDSLPVILQDTVSDDALEPAFKALCLTMPSEGDIAREIGSAVDTDLVHAARQALGSQIANSCGDVFAACYENIGAGGTYAPDAKGAGVRALRQALLNHLCVADGDVTRAVSAYQSANNMTDLSNALMIIVHQAPQSQAAQTALEDFKARYINDPIVLDKWLTVQATIPHEQTLERVIALTQDPVFTWKNPNRVRALIGGFTSGNPFAFNRKDGAGYDFLCDAAARLDGFNPQVAARLMTFMRSWKMLETGRQKKARASIERLAAVPTLSRDLREIVSRIAG